MKYTENQIIESARGYSSRGEWHDHETPLYHAARRMGLLEKIYAILPAGKNNQSPYTDDDLLAHARQFQTNKEWFLSCREGVKNGIPSCYKAAYKRGKEFFQRCVAHMTFATPPPRYKYTEQQIIESARKYQYKSDWKKGDLNTYQSASSRPEVFALAASHMRPKSHPYSGSYIIYAYEFADHHAYVGLTFKPRTRFSQHFEKGPVFLHYKYHCSDCILNILERGIEDPNTAAEAEKRWILDYMRKGWTMLNHSGGGSLGTVAVKWTREAVLAEARKYATKQEWIDKSQRSYRIAKVEGWFDEAAAHMPLRDARHLVGREFSEETREKMSKAAQRRGADPEWRADHSAALKGRPWSEESRAAHM